MENLKTCKGCTGSFPQEEMAYKGLRRGKKTYRVYCKECDSKSDRVQKHRKKRSVISKRLRAEFDEYKKTLKCTDCYIDFKDAPWLCDFHHLDPTTKDRTVRGVSYLVQLNTKERLAKELEKCIPLCPNCHRTRHHFWDNKEAFRAGNAYKKISV